MSIAESYGFFWETLWNLPANKAIREARRDPTVLLPGDVVTIPGKTVKASVPPTGELDASTQAALREAHAG